MAVTAAEMTAITGSRVRPIMWWAFIGGLFVALDVYVFGAWILSDEFRPQPPGDTPVPGFVMFWVRFWEFVSIALGVGCLVYLVRCTFRKEAFPTLAIFMIAWQLSLWQDPIINFIRPMFTYSSAFYNMGSWSSFVPGWISPNGSRMPEPIFFQVGMYMFGITMGCMLCFAAMRAAKRRWPSLNAVQLVGIACLTGISFDMFLEFFWLRMQLYSYLGTIHAATAYDGELWQFPFYNFMIWGCVLGICGSLYYFKDDKGRMLVERGVETIRSRRGQTVARVLATTAFINLIYLTYSVIMILSTLYIDPWASGLPSWMRNDMCGAGTQYECPGPDVAIPLPESGPLPPFTGRN
ncbi:MAG TPA: spirocyclase AveC family protein [Nevskiaceae bacterium]|nr:spirocyclase AveC family protein [Nevskiaceae bacterium]